MIYLRDPVFNKKGATTICTGDYRRALKNTINKFEKIIDQKKRRCMQQDIQP